MFVPATAPAKLEPQPLFTQRRAASSAATASITPAGRAPERANSRISNLRAW